MIQLIKYLPPKPRAYLFMKYAKYRLSKAIKKPKYTRNRNVWTLIK